MNALKPCLLILLIFLTAACEKEALPDGQQPDTSNALVVTPVSFSQLQNNPAFTTVLAKMASKTDVGKTAKETADYTIVTSQGSKAAFLAYQAYTFPIVNPNQPPFSFDNYVLRKHHNGSVEAFILRYHYDMEAWLENGVKTFSHITRFDTEYNPIADSSPTTTALKNTSFGLKSPCEVYVTIYHETPQDGTYQWQPGAVCQHTTEGDQCTIIIEYTIDCSGAGGGAPSDTLMGEGDTQGSQTDYGIPQQGEILPDNGGLGAPISIMEPPLGPEENADAMAYLREVIEAPVTVQTTEEELLNKNNALAAWLLQLNPEIFQDVSLLLLSINSESELSKEDRLFLWEKAQELYNIIKAKEESAGYHTTAEEFLNSLSSTEKENYMQNITTTALLPAVKSLTGLQWPQSTAEWQAIFNFIKPMLIEIGIEFLPLGGVYNAINDMAEGLSEGDYTTAALGLAGVVMEFIPWAKLVKVAKALFSVGKKAFKVFKLGYHFLQQLGEAIGLGLRTTLDGSTVKLLKANGDEVARISDNILYVSKHGIKAAEGSVVFRHADELNAGLATDFGYINPPPFKETVTEFVTAEAEQFVRFHGPDNQISAFVMKASDVQDLSVEQIRDLYAIANDNPITKVSFVNVPAGTKIHGGLANEGLGFNGGGYQFYIDRTQFESTYVDSNWFSEPIEVENFLN